MLNFGGVIPENEGFGGFPFCWNKFIDLGLGLGGLFYWLLHSQISSDPEMLKLRANQKHPGNWAVRPWKWMRPAFYARNKRSILCIYIYTYSAKKKTEKNGGGNQSCSHFSSRAWSSWNHARPPNSLEVEPSFNISFIAWELRVSPCLSTPEN